MLMIEPITHTKTNACIGDVELSQKVLG